MTKPPSIPLYKATAAILAGGRSSRMGQDKAFLPGRDGRPLIETLVDRLRPLFAEMLLSANDIERYAYLGLPVLPDHRAGEGPMQGIVSCLEAAAYDSCFIIGCDIPDLDYSLISTMMSEPPEKLAVVPRSPDGFIEPVFAIYRKGMLPRFRAVLDSGERRIRMAFEDPMVSYVPVPDRDYIRSINRPEEYAAWLDWKQ